jgi:UDP-N-acetylmuramate--alanine ligase
MRLPDNISSVYFLGIGGIGMSALARYFSHHGYRVSGYDRTPSSITNQLVSDGIQVHYTDMGPEIGRYTGSPEKTMVIITPAIPNDHGELQWLRKNRFTIVKRAAVLGQICESFKCLAIAGTHGKTTVSTMAATILQKTQQGCGAILGGISKNFGTNLILPREDSLWMVTEADEYDRSFLQISPDIAVITSMDADHLDIYNTYEEVVASFMEFAGRLRANGKILLHKNIADKFSTVKEAHKLTYSLSDDADFNAKELTLDEKNLCYMFRLSTPSGNTPLIRMQYPGRLNVENAIAAGAAAWLAGAGPEEIKRGLEAYQGVRRRFDILYKGPRTVYIDDYAHHPEELKALITSVRLLFPGKYITGIFQPHLYSRTRDLANEFAHSLDLLDEAVILPVYPAREKPIEGVNAAMLSDRMALQKKHLLDKHELKKFIKEHPADVLLTMGAGDIDLLTGEIIEILENEKGN